MSLPYDSEKAIALLKSDPPFAQLIEQVGAYRLELREMVSPFHGLMRSIVYQQLSGQSRRDDLQPRPCPLPW